MFPDITHPSTVVSPPGSAALPLQLTQVRSRSTLTADAVHFSSPRPRVSNARPLGLRFGNGETAGGLKGAFSNMGRALKSPGWWFNQLGVSAAVTVMTCWLPGSQLILIPAYLGAALVYKGWQGYRAQPASPSPAAKAQGSSGCADAARQPQETELHSHSHPQESQEAREFSLFSRIGAGVKSAWKQVIHDQKANFMQNATLSGVMTLATCWLPGSQLLTIPMWFCIDAAMSIFHGAKYGYQHPERFTKSASA